MAKPTTLFQYYSQKGQALPSWRERAPIYESLGLGPASEYEGTGSQNNKLLAALLKQGVTPEPIDADTQKAQKIIDENPNASIQQLFNKVGSETNLSIIDTNELIKTSPQGIKAETKPETKHEPTGNFYASFMNARNKQEYYLGPFQTEQKASDAMNAYKNKMGTTAEFYMVNSGTRQGQPSGIAAPSLPGEKEEEKEEKVVEKIEGKAFQEFDAYKNLSEDDKLFVDEVYKLIEFGGEDEARIFANAIEQAKGIADPFFKAKLGLGLAEVIGTIAESRQDYQTQREVLERARDEILEDVRLGRGFLTLEQQADMARLTRGYGEDILRIADVAAEKGLTFATGARSRALAETQRAEQFQDVVQSGTRGYNLRMKELELRASRGETSAQKELEALKSSQVLQLQKIGRGAEELLGTKELTGITSLEDYQRVGGLMGTIEEQKRKSLISDIGGFVELQQGFLNQ